jgi:hypothetical protein
MTAAFAFPASFLGLEMVKVAGSVREKWEGTPRLPSCANLCVLSLLLPLKEDRERKV